MHNPYAQPGTQAATAPGFQPTGSLQHGSITNPYAHPATHAGPQASQAGAPAMYPPVYSAATPAPASAPTIAPPAPTHVSLYPPVLHGAPPPPAATAAQRQGSPPGGGRAFDRCASYRGFPDQPQVEAYQLPSRSASVLGTAHDTAAAPVPQPRLLRHQPSARGFPEQLQVETYKLPPTTPGAGGMPSPGPAPAPQWQAPGAKHAPLQGGVPGLQSFPEHLQIDTCTVSTTGQPSVTSSTSGTHAYHTAPEHRRAAGARAAKDPRDALIDELSDLALRQPPVPFADRYLLLDERVEAGQSVVNFARDSRDAQQQYAIKCALVMLELSGRLSCSSLTTWARNVSVAAHERQAPRAALAPCFADTLRARVHTGNWDFKAL